MICTVTRSSLGSSIEFQPHCDYRARGGSCLFYPHASACMWIEINDSMQECHIVISTIYEVNVQVCKDIEDHNRGINKVDSANQLVCLLVSWLFNSHSYNILAPDFIVQIQVLVLNYSRLMIELYNAYGLK